MEELTDNLIALAIEIQQIPAPTFHEAERAEFVHGRFLKEGLQDVETDEAGNVYARLPGGGAPPVVVSAHLDTVFPIDTPLDLRRQAGRIYGPGLGDNSLAVAGLVGLVWHLRDAGIQLEGDLWLAANVAEEGLGNLKGMRAVVDRFGPTPNAYIILEGTALGQVYHRALAVRRYRVQAQTQGGHSWVNFGRPSAIHELAKVVAALSDLELPSEPRTSMNVGMIEGGTSVNTIAPEAELLLDLRSVDKKMLDRLDQQVNEIFAAYRSSEVEILQQRIGDRPAGMLYHDHPLVELAKDCLEAIGLPASLNIGSTDANIPLSRGLLAVCIGLTKGKGAHTMDEYIEVPPLTNGLKQLSLLVQGAFALPAAPE